MAMNSITNNLVTPALNAGIGIGNSAEQLELARRLGFQNNSIAANSLVARPAATSAPAFTLPTPEPEFQSPRPRPF